jgi:hypothetical protein
MCEIKKGVAISAAPFLYLSHKYYKIFEKAFHLFIIYAIISTSLTTIIKIGRKK